jgi:hypothetical protein
MDLTNEAAVGGSEATSIAVAPAPAGETPLGLREAARNLVNWRQSREKPKSRPPTVGEGEAVSKRVNVKRTMSSRVKLFSW